VTVSPRKKRIPWWKQLSNHERKSKPGGSPPKPNNKNRKEDHMKSIKRAIRLIAVQRGLSTSVALGADPVAGREEHPITRSRPRRWTAVLALVIALLPGTAPAQEADTLTISGTFSMDYLNSESDLNWFVPDLVEVYANGHEHTWTLTLHGTTHSHFTFSAFGVKRATQIHATSFDLEFFGPDAATLNGLVSDHLAGGDVFAYLENSYSSGFGGGDFAIMYVWVSAGDPGISFYTGQEMGVFTLFPADADGYPVVGPEPFSIEPDYTELGYSDMMSSTGGAIGSLAGPVTFEGSVGEPEPEQVVLAVADASVLEGNRGTSNVAVAVTLSSASSQAITVHYATANGTALANSDYTATSGTLTFQPGETSRTISVSIKGDRKREANEIFSVQLSNAVGATIDDGVATVTILNDD
jgi:hypothetical protein